ncbi:MAG: glycosyltransferase [Methylomarinum sp.]|nr:glycosyltransferase [Methylomarinum sp.]
MSKLKISIAICTWNRADSLKETLTRLVQLNIPKEVNLNVIVVNNNSTDHTDEVIESFKKLLPITHVFEKKPGVSNARNKAVEVASGDYILWTDDDVLVDKNWLSVYTEYFLNNSDIDVFGGPILPYYEGSPPKWLVNGIDAIRDAFALRNLSSYPIPFIPRSEALPFGANFAIKLETQIKYLYSPKLGRQPGNINLLGEETLVINKILDSNKKGLWIPEAIVHHRVPLERQSIKYVSDYFIGKGESIGYVPTGSEKLLFGKPIWLLLQIMKLHFNFLYQRLFLGELYWLQALKQRNINIGLLKSIKNHES